MKWFARTLFTLLAAAALAPSQASETSSTLVGSNSNCLDSSGVLSTCSGGSDQRFIFGAGGTVFVATAQGNLYLQGDASGKSVSLSRALATGNASTYWTRPGGDHLQLTVAGSATALCLSWKAAVRSFDDSGNPIRVPTAGLEVCAANGAGAPNEKWTLASPLAADWPYTAKTQVKGNAGKCLQESDFKAPLLASKLAVSACTAVATNEYFQFSNQGAIVLNGFCLMSSGGVGSLVSLGSCGDTGVPPAANQQWKRGTNSTFVSVSTGLCLGIRNRATQDNAGLDLESCDASNPFQQWSTSSAVSGAWPAGLASAPSTYVPGQTLSSGQVSTLVNWVQGETSISSTPFCYKTKAYDRSSGIAPDCGSGKYKDGLLCYSNCRSGFHAVGPVCWSDQSLSYTPGSTCTTRDSLGTCWAWKQDGCRAGYTNVLGVCWLDKSSYPNGAGSGPDSCKSNRVLQAGLCYDTPRSGYQCNATSCNQRCASGITDCGAAACASDANQCANTISNMVVSSAMMIGSFATAGAAGEAKSAVMTAKNAYKIATKADDLAQAALTLASTINNFMNLAENNLAAISSSDIEAKIAARYPPVSADYRHIAREWAARQMMFYMADLIKDLDTLIITSIDPTGITGVIDAFTKPTCKDHSAMP